MGDDRKRQPRTPRGKYAPKEKVVTETVILSDLNPGNRFVLNDTRYYIAATTDEGVLCMSLIQVRGAWSGGVYRTFDSDTKVGKLNV